MRLTVLPTLIALAALSAPAGAQEGKAALVDKNGKAVGTATFRGTSGGVLISTDLTGLAPGEHAIHVHTTGTCDPAAGFESASSHFKVGEQKHGYLAEGGPHAGDMPNQYVGSDGVLKAEIFNAGISLGSGDTSVFDSDGAALVLHAKGDDYTSQPSGEAGGRIACGVIQKP
jgi:Cu-Zn family superoxide dismutase